MRMRAGGVLHIGLAEAAAGLAQELAVGAQHHDRVRREAGEQHQAIEAVILRRAGPNLTKRLLETPTGLGDIDRRLPRLHSMKFLDPNWFFRTPRLHFEGNFIDHPQAEILQHRQHVGERGRLAQMERLQA